jgi:membrane-bound metal-dependent hydrolase YbcI (DUF457 family)
MNVKYHLACGVALDLAAGTKGIMTLFSVLPDTPLLLNEYHLWKEKRAFKAEDVSRDVMEAYFLSHSLFAAQAISIFSHRAALAYLIHIVADWFTHTGRFASRPFYPAFNYQIKFGREILK